MDFSQTGFYSTCETSLQYVSGTLATSTELCYNPAVSFVMIFMTGILLFFTTYLIIKILK